MHADLFGPLKTSDKGKKFILCITDAFTKYVELAALPNKEAATVAEAIFDKFGKGVCDAENELFTFVRRF